MEAMKDLGNSTAKSLGDDVLKQTSQEFLRQLFGQMKQPSRKVTGEMKPGQSLEPAKAFSGEQAKAEETKKQLGFERRIHQEEKALLEKKSRDLTLQIHAITQELQGIAHATPKLAQQIEFASIQAPVDPGVYHVIFFEKLLEFMKSFRKKIENANMWLSATNKRANKRNFWNQYKQQKGQALLNPETYNSRNAG
jgi:hypothetical protein